MVPRQPVWRLVKVLEGQLRAVMDHGHAELLRAPDPLAEDGAVARFLRELRQELKAADQDRSTQLEAAWPPWTPTTRVRS